MTWFANGLDVLTMRLLIPWTGVWTAELTLDAPAAPKGPIVVASADGASLVGTVDPDRSGKFGERVTVGVVGGRGGWSKSVKSQHFHSPVGVPLAVVVAATAAEVLELATVADPELLGEDYVRVAGAASQVLDGRSWHVALDGTTFVGPRIPKPMSLDVEVLEWDPAAGVAVAACDGIIVPGTILVDERFGTKTVREVELVIESTTLRANLRLIDAPTTDPQPLRLAEELGAIARAAVRPEWMRLHEYRVIFQPEDTVELQAVDVTGPVPDLLPCPVWAGISGYKAKLRPGSRVLVAFIGGEETRPVLVAYEPPDDDGWRPLELDLDALVRLGVGSKVPLLELDAAGLVTVGKAAPLVALGAAAGVPIALAPPVLAFATALHAALDAAAVAVAGTGPTLGVAPAAALAAIMATLASAVGGASGAMATTAPSKKVVAI